MTTETATQLVTLRVTYTPGDPREPAKRAWHSPVERFDSIEVVASETPTRDTDDR